MGVANMSAANITSDGTARLYFNMSAINWWTAGTNGNGNFAYFFNNSTGKNAWSAHSVKYDGNTYYVVIPAGTWAGVILTRNNTSTAPSWDNKWNQTGDITLSSTSNYISKFSEGSTSVTWGTAIKPASTGSLTASSTSVNIGADVTLTPSLTSNQTINDINSTSYSISPNSGASISGNTFTATKAETYTVTATITYNPDGYTSLTSTVSPAPTVTIKVNPWTITWDPNGGSITPTSSTYDGATAVSLPTPTRTGYNFDGWYTAASGGTKINDIGTTTKPTSNVTYYAHWTPKTYTITLNANGGASNGSATATYNSNTVKNATYPTRTDYRCNGYYTAASGGTLVLYTTGTLAKNVSGYTDADGNWTKDAAATLYAQWTYDVTEYAVTFGAGTGFTSYGSVTAKNNSTSAAITSPATVRSGQSVTFTATPKTGYIVEGWYTNAACTAGKHDAGNTTYTTSITSATNVYVKFVEKTWSVAFTAGTGGTVTTPSSTPQTVGQVKGINIIAETNTGYTFAGWTSSNGGEFDDTKAEETKFYPTAATTVTANFTENLHTIAVQTSNNNHGTVTKSDDKAGIATTIIITATPKEGYRFVNWTTTTAGITIADANNASTTVTATAAGTITANFEEIPLETIYFVNKDNWSKVNVYRWGGSAAGDSWPGIEATKADFQLHCCDVYYVSALPGSYKKCIFSNNGSNQTGDLDWTAGKYFHDGAWKTLNELTYEVKLAGSMLVDNGNWVLQDMTVDANSTNSITISLEANQTYKFKIVVDGNWHGNNGTMTNGHSTDWTMSTSEGDCQITTTAAGEYTFTYNVCGAKLTVTYPALDSYTITYNTNGGTNPDNAISEFDVTTATFNLPNPNKTGYTFVGWFDNEELTGDAVTQITKGTTGNKEFWAKWTATEYTITYEGLNDVTHSNPTTYTIESETITFTNPTSERTGYTFTGWNPTQIAKGSTGNQTVTAQWNEILSTITITTNPAEGGRIEVDGQQFTPGNTVQVGVATTKKVTAVPNEGYGVAAWGVSNREIVNASGGATVTLKSDGSGSTGTLTANFIGLEYTITFDKQEGTEGTDKATVRYMGNEYSVSPVVTPTRVGYTFGGYYTAGAGVQVVSAEGQWLANATDYTDADRKWLVKENTTLYAKWTANTYIVTLDQEGAAEKGDASVRADYNANMPELGKLPTAHNGYAFMGYFDQKDGKGTQYYYADGTSAHTWDKTGNASLYAYFAVPKIDVTLDKSTFEPGAENVTATAIVTPTPAGTTTICWELLYTNDNPVENHAPSPEKGNRVQFNISDLVAGTYKIKATLRMGDGCEGEEISSSEHTFLISSSHTITIKYICDGKEIQSKTTIEANVSSTTTYTAPDIVGYTFSNWEVGDGVTITETNGKEVTFNAIYDGYLTAKYTKNSNIIYFYNTLGWENVYVYFYSGDYWDSNKGTGTKSGGTYKGYLPMVRMGESNIWYVNAAEKATTYLVFGKDEQDNYDNFSDTEVIRRGDYNSSLPMFVPIADQEPTELNNYTDKEGKKCVTKYYNKGYWMNYPENTGYTLDLFNHHSDNDPARYFIYPYSKNTIFPLQLEVEINAENIVDGDQKIWFRIHRNDGKNFGGHATNFPTVNPTATGGFIAENDYKVELITPIAGTYTFMLDYKYDETAKDYQYHIEVDYPAKVGDYRILYRDEAETNWSGNTKPVEWYHPSRVIKKGEDRKDIISFYINTDVRRRLSYQTIKSINNETGAITWNTEEVQFDNIDWSQITKSGVYNFTFVQDGKGISVENDIVPYTGNYYIRTDAMGGGWEDYKTNSENRMTYSSFSESDANSFGEKFSHYAVKWCKAGTNVKFTIANDYSQCISDTLAQDVIPLGNLTDEGTLQNREIYDANIRFMWNWKSNKISRAYVGPAGDKQSQFLMLRSCSEFKDAVGNDLDPNEGDILDKENDIYAARFTDTQNWIYERTIQVKPSTRVKLYASYPKVYHIYIENLTGWKDVALYAWKGGGDQPLGNWPGIQPTRTVEIEDKTYYDFQVSEYVFGSNLIFNNNDGGQQKDNYQIQTIGDYYLTASSNSQLSLVKNVSTTVEATAQYFRGEYAEGSCDNENTVQILGGEGDTWNTIRVIYDFKTNRLMAAWMPNNNEIDTVRSIESDVMIIRDHQNAAQCITFANDDSKLTNVKTVYGVMRFNRWILNNRGGEDKLNIESCTKVVNNQTVYDQETTNTNHPVLDINKQKSQYERALYFISFPFDVHLSDVFGFGTYGQHWIIEYYDGLKRAREGYWIDSDPNWKYVTNPTDFILKAYEGYILCLNLGKMAYDNTDFWAHNISQVELFFPSFTTMEEISKIEVTMPSLGEEYLCKINRGDGTEGDRRVKDSYWRCIGVPSYANYSNVLKDEKGETIKWQTSYKTFPFLYAWNMTDNTLTPQSTSNFPFKTMHAYLVQNGGEIHWSAVSATPEPASIVARKEAPSNNYEWKLTLSRNEQVEDQAFVRLSNDEKITNNFDFNQDLSKEFNYGRSDIYTLIGYEKAAANSLPFSEQTTLIPLGLSIEYNGDYTIAMPDGTANIGVTLVDNQTGTRTNLSAGMEYTLTLNKGDYNNRFFIEISPIQQTPTDIEYVTGDSNSQDNVRKVLIDNILYIVRDGQIFDARGARVK